MRLDDPRTTGEIDGPDLEIPLARGRLRADSGRDRSGRVGSSGYRCERCRGPLRKSVEPSDGLACLDCGQRVATRDGIPSFVRDPDFFYGEIPRESMRTAAEAARLEGWPAAFQRMLASVDPSMASYIEQYIGDESRAAWKYLLGLPREGTALDLGCGWGVTSLSMARSLSRVVSMDLTLERLLLLRERALAEGLDNLDYVHAGDRLPLPLADQSMDVVVLNGVLEWFPVSYPGDPRAAQVALLTDLRRILRPTGQLYIGIENRFGYRYYLGQLDEHSQLKYTSLMPRWLADLWSIGRSGRSYRTYTHGLSGYRRLLADSGFDTARFYCPFPDYREFRTLVEVGSSRAVRRLFQPSSRPRRVLLDTVDRLGVLDRVVPSFGIVASGPQGGPSFLDRLVATLLERLGTPLGPISKVLATQSDTVIGFCQGLDRRPEGLAVRLPLTALAESRASREFQNLQRLPSDRRPPDDRGVSVIPEAIDSGRFDGQFYTVVDAKSGINAEQALRSGAVESATYRAVGAWLTLFQRDRGPSPIRWNSEALTSRAVALIDEVKERIPELRPTFDRYRDLATRLGASIAVESPRVVPSHGDLHVGNVLLDESTGRISGVVDWDLFEPEGLPMTDLLYLLLRRRFARPGQGFASSIRGLARPESLDPIERSMIEAYERDFDLNPAFRPSIMTWMVLGQLAQNARIKSRNLPILCLSLPETLDFLCSRIIETR